MKWLQRLFIKLNGLYYPQEYLCLNKETFEHTLLVYLLRDGHVVKDITDLHLFIGYHPLVIALEASKSALPQIEIVFSHDSLPLNAMVVKKDAIATITLHKTAVLQQGNEVINLYEGLQATHRFVSPFHQFVINKHNE